MRIGIDIDDVITNTSEIIEEFVDKSSNKDKLKMHMKDIMKGTPKDPEVIKFCMDIYLKVFKKVKVKDNAEKVIIDLLDDGHEVYLITARGDRVEFFKGSEELTKMFLDNNDIRYTRIIFNAIDKASLCLNNKIDVLIDDSVEHCEDVEKVGVKSILFTSNVNKNIATTIERVDNWQELKEKLEELV